MKKIFLIFALLFSVISYSYWDYNVKINKIQEKFWPFALFPAYDVASENYWSLITDEKWNVFNVNLDWDLSILTGSLASYKDNLKVFVENWGWKMIVFTWWSIKTEQNKLTLSTNYYWKYTIAPIIPQWKIVFNNIEKEYLWDNKTIYSIISDNINSNIWETIVDWFEFNIWFSTNIHLTWDNITKTTNSNKQTVYKIKTKDWKVKINFTVDSNKDTWLISVYNSYTDNMPTSQWNISFDVKSSKKEVLPPKNLTIKNNVIYWQKSEDAQVNWYVLYLKKTGSKDFLPFDNWNLKSPRLFVWELYSTWQYREIVDFKSWDEFDIALKSIDIFWNLSDFSNIVTFKYYEQCLQEPDCRWKFYSPFNDNSSDNNSNNIPNKNISEQQTVENIINYIEKFNKQFLDNNSNTYKWVDINYWSLRLKKYFKLTAPFNLFYNSNSILNSHLWIGWNTSFDYFFNYYETKWEFSVILPDGNANIFSIDNSLQFKTKYSNWISATQDKDDLDVIIVSNPYWDKFYFNKNANKLTKIFYKNYWEIRLEYSYNWISKVIWENSVIFINYNDNWQILKITDNNWNSISFIFNDSKYLISINYNWSKELISYYNTGLLKDIWWTKYLFDNNKVINIQDNYYYDIDYNNKTFSKKYSYNDNIISKIQIKTDNNWIITSINEWSWILLYTYKNDWQIQIWKNLISPYQVSQSNNNTFFTINSNWYIINSKNDKTFVLWNNKQIFSFDDKNIYRLLPNWKFLNLWIKDLNNVSSLYIANNWDIYITDSNYIKLFHNWTTKIIYWKNNKEPLSYITVDETSNTIYFTEKYNKWIKVLKDNQINSLDESKNIYVNWLGYFEWKLTVNSFGNWDKPVTLNNEIIFDYLLWDSLNKLTDKINNLSSDKKSEIVNKLLALSKNLKQTQYSFNKDRILYIIKTLLNWIE